MSNLSKIFRKVPVDVQNRSGYDASFEHVLTQKVGTITPLACIECVPAQKIELGFFGQVALPPMATDFYGRVDYCVEAFWVPGRLLYGGFEEVFTHNTGDNVPGLPSPTYTSWIPGFSFGYDSSICGAGTLLDYLGFKISQDSTSGAATTVNVDNVLPLLGYHLIWQEFYRDSRITAPVVTKRGIASTTASTQGYIGQLPGLGSLGYASHVFITGQGARFADNTYVYELRQRCYGKDRFTNATFEPQQGTPTSLQFAVSGGTGSFTIGSFLTAYGYDNWKRKMNISGRYGDQQFADWGVYPDSYFCDRPVYLGSARFGIYNKSVYQSASNDQDQPHGHSQNPFSELTGAKYGSPVGVSDGSLVSNFMTSERGYLYVMGTVVPHSYYSTGIDPKFRRYRVTDFAVPSWQVMGDEPILTSELSDDAVTAANPTVFGYTQRFSSYKWNTDLVSGLLRDGESLSSFALKRSFGSTPTLGTAFLEIPTTALDEVAASSTRLPSSYGAWADIFFKLHTSMPLSAYSIPTLGQQRDTHTVMVESGGVRL